MCRSRSAPPLRTTVVAALVAAFALLLGVTQPAAATTSANLILNGDAETGQCSPWGFEETTVPGWSITTGNTQVSGVPQGPGDPV
ncbi:hypothetical protein ACH41H_50090, partial [Streptomyces sp. NPDC020800]|uniref:hypothetical protein n=1 Tax=Streptomyces sp. NPDC020800 TaxID=3365092 RepID=UPI0037912371